MATSRSTRLEADVRADRRFVGLGLIVLTALIVVGLSFSAFRRSDQVAGRSAWTFVSVIGLFFAAAVFFRNRRDSQRPRRSGEVTCEVFGHDDLDYFAIIGALTVLFFVACMAALSPGPGGHW